MTHIECNTILLGRVSKNVRKIQFVSRHIARQYREKQRRVHLSVLWFLVMQVYACQLEIGIRVSLGKCKCVAHDYLSVECVHLCFSGRWRIDFISRSVREGPPSFVSRTFRGSYAARESLRIDLPFVARLHTYRRQKMNTVSVLLKLLTMFRASAYVVHILRNSVIVEGSVNCLQSHADIHHTDHTDCSLLL